ncbi:hypothetical protein LXA43DRAFT_1155504, partial [Ganoderma leucocontextum]
STSSAITARHNAVTKRDRFLGEAGCVVCGEQDEYGLVDTLIVPGTDEGTHRWKELRRMGALPEHAQPLPEFDPQNGVVMCATHDVLFKKHAFYIRFDLESERYVSINVTSRSQHKFHGRAVGLDIHDQDAPYPAAFQAHEMQVREDNSSYPSVPSIPTGSEIEWQDWLLSRSIVDLDTGFLRRVRLPPSNDNPEVLSGFATDDGGEISNGAASDPIDDPFDPEDALYPDHYTDEELLVIRDRISACLASRQAFKSPVAPPSPPAHADRTHSASRLQVRRHLLSTSPAQESGPTAMARNKP